MANLDCRAEAERRIRDAIARVSDAAVLLAAAQESLAAIAGLGPEYTRCARQSEQATALYCAIRRKVESGRFDLDSDAKERLRKKAEVPHG